MSKTLEGDDLRALCAAATEQALRLTPCECADETGYIRMHETTCPVEWMAPLRNHADALDDLADTVKAIPRHRYPDEKTGTCYRCFLPWPCPTERAHRALDALEADRG